MRHKQLILWAIGILLSWPLQGQDLYYSMLDKSQGLPSNEVYNIFQDSQGFIWVAHERGLSRYDGYEFKNFEDKNQNAKAGTGVREDKYGRIWYQNFDGWLYYVERDTLWPLALQNRPLGYMQYGLDGQNLYILQERGVDIFDLRTLKIRMTVPIEEAPYVTRTHFTAGHFYITRKEGIERVDSNGNVFTFKHLDTLTHLPPSYVIEGDKELILFEREVKGAGLYVLKDSSYVPKFKLPLGIFIQNAAYLDSVYWFCASDGLYAFDVKGKPLSGAKPFLAGHNISCIIQDREQNFWIGTKNEGIFFVQDIAARRLYPDFSCYRLFKLDSLLYAGGTREEIYTINKNYQNRLFYQSNSSHEIEVLGYDSIAKLFLVQGQKFMHISPDGKEVASWTAAVKNAIRINEKYTAYAVSGTFGLSQHPQFQNPNPWDNWHKKHLQKDILPSLVSAPQIVGCRARTVVYDKTNERLLFATSQGLWLIQPDTSYEIKTHNSSLAIHRLCLHNQNTYASDMRGQLFVLKDTLQPLALPLPKAKVKNLKLIDNQLFILSDEALFLLDSNQTIKQVHLYYNELNDFHLFNNKLFLATNKGILVQELIKIDDRPLNPIFCIASIKANEQKITTTSQLPYNQNDIEIKYNILSFKTNGQFPLYYQINDGNWQLAAPETRTLRLPALAFGYYKINFRLANNNPQKTNFPIHTIEFEILPPWWRQWWFIFTSIATSLCIIYAYFRQQTNMLRRQNALLNDKVALERDLNRSTLKAIKSQMNPHFLYNALNSIQAQILADDKKTAILLLNKFTRLSRLVLDMSEADLISLDEEIKALRLYLDLEKARFDGQDFQYHLDLPHDLDTHNLRLPAMLIQPYVENAIKHGLLHQQGPKRLHISFTTNQQNLIVNIHDNGIGRHRAEEINKNRTNHTSFATRANQKRLHILAANAQYTDHQNPTGTTVLLQIPLETNDNQ